MTTLQLAIIAGLLCGSGVALIVLRLLPDQPNLISALERLAPERRNTTAAPDTGDAGSLQDRVGRYLQRRTPVARWWTAPAKDLALLRIPVHRYYGEKALFALLGLAFPPLLDLGFLLVTAAAGHSLSFPWPIPSLVGVALAATLSFLPNYNVHDDAAAAREQFTFGLASYIDGIAMLRQLGAGLTEAIEGALEPVHDSWVFNRLREQLTVARLAHTEPWDAFDQLADDLAIPELADLADQLRLNAKTGAPITDSLRERATSLRDARLSRDQLQAGAAGERMSIPTSALVLVFLALLAAPAILQTFR